MAQSSGILVHPESKAEREDLPRIAIFMNTRTMLSEQ
jgi:hypothetical protein